MQRLRLWIIIAAALAVIGGGLFAWWALDLRWRPHAIVRGQSQIGAILQSAGWVSPHAGGPKLYVVCTRASPGCDAFDKAELPRLLAARVDVRMIMIAPADSDGLARSTPAERATVAELWVNRDWRLLQRWIAVTPPSAWTAAGIPPADGDAARAAVIAAGRRSVDELRPLLRSNGVDLTWPVMVWWNSAGAMRGCACTQAPAWRKVEKDLGA